MGNLRSALEEEANLDLSHLSGPDLADRVREVDHARRLLDSVWFTTLNSSSPRPSRLPRYPLTVVTASQ